MADIASQENISKNLKFLNFGFEIFVTSNNKIKSNIFKIIE